MTIYDLELVVHYDANETQVVDVNCDSKFMAGVMDDVGTAMRIKMSWVPAHETIYLFMDNAGGHGTDAAVKKYTEELEDRHNIIIIQQVPRSPETNMLDLGVWRSIQCAVEKEHLYMRYHADSLARTVERAWDTRLKPEAFKKVYDRLYLVLRLIIEDNGGNNLVESKRGKLFRDPVLPDEMEQQVDDAEPEAHDLLFANI